MVATAPGRVRRKPVNSWEVSRAPGKWSMGGSSWSSAVTIEQVFEEDARVEAVNRMARRAFKWSEQKPANWTTRRPHRQMQLQPPHSPDACVVRQKQGQLMVGARRRDRTCRTETQRVQFGTALKGDNRHDELSQFAGHHCETGAARTQRRVSGSPCSGIAPRRQWHG
jgi:hypothetical protein